MSDVLVVHVICRSSADRAELARSCFSLGAHAEIYGNYEELLSIRPQRGVVLAEDMVERGGTGGLLERIVAQGNWLPVIGAAHAPSAGQIVEAVRAGAVEYIRLPARAERLASALHVAAAEGDRLGTTLRQAAEARKRLERLTQREREVLDKLVGGASNKIIARELQISPRTVEIHRAHMMAKLGAHHAAEAVRLRLEADMASAAGGAAMVARIPPLAA